MRRLLIVYLIGVSSVAHAGWDQITNSVPNRPGAQVLNLPPMTVLHMPSYTLADGTLSNNSAIDFVAGYDWGNGQYADIYYNNAHGPLTPGTVLAANCVFVYYHGGSWLAGDPSEGTVQYPAAPLPNTQPASFNYTLPPFHIAAQTLGCIVVSMSYPLSERNSLGHLTAANIRTSTPSVYESNTITLQRIMGNDVTPNRNGSVFQTFDAFYNNVYLPWKTQNPNLYLMVGGASAGAYIAMRVATDGRWPVSQALVTGVPVPNPRARSATTVGLMEDAQTPGDPNACMTKYGPDCIYFREVYTGIPNDGSVRPLFSTGYNGGPNSMDLHLYTGHNPALTMTYYINSICDDLTEVGAALPGWFNDLPVANRQLMVHKSIKYTPNTGAVAVGMCSPPTCMPVSDGTGHGRFFEMLNDFQTVNANSTWIFNSFVNGPPATWAPPGTYAGSCDDLNLKSRLRN
jgi:acetyl esterase/lipase